MDESLSELYRQELYRTLLRPQTPLSRVTQLPRTASLSDLLSPSRPRQRIGVRPRFSEFRKNLALTPLQFTDGKKKRAGVVSCPNNAYGWMRPDSACRHISRL